MVQSRFFLYHQLPGLTHIEMEAVLLTPLNKVLYNIPVFSLFCVSDAPYNSLAIRKTSVGDIVQSCRRNQMYREWTGME